MVNLTVFRIKDQITRCCFTDRNLHSILRLCCGCPWKTDTELCIYMLCETGTVCSVNRICSSPYIWVTDKLQCIIDQSLAGWILNRGFFHWFERIIAYFIVFRCYCLFCKTTYSFRILSRIGIFLCFFFCFFTHQQVFTLCKSTYITGFHIYPFLILTCQYITNLILG